MLSSWQPLTKLYRMVGDTVNQQIAEQRVRELEALPKALVAVKSALNQNNLQTADVHLDRINSTLKRYDYWQKSLIAQLSMMPNFFLKVLWPSNPNTLAHDLIS